MDRVLVLRLESLGIVAEAVFNGVPLWRTVAQLPGPPAQDPAAGPAEPQCLSISVNEYVTAGSNRLELRLQPAAPCQAAEGEPWISDGQRGACLRLLLPRKGQRAHPETARTLAQLDWAPVADALVELPALVTQTLDLPINFPRWRWLDAPPVGTTVELAALQAPAATFLQGLALGLSRGDAEPLVQASRLRLEELSQAYQHDLADSVGRLRQQVQQLHAAMPLRPAMPKASTVLLRMVADGRLLECLAPDGQALLRSAVAGSGQVAWPLRLAFIEGRFYVLR